MGASQVTQPFDETKDISETLKEKMVILIKARVAPQAKRFAINLACGNEEIAFHFNPRYDECEPVVVCNSFIKFKWGQEERKLSMPFRRGKSFEMTITIWQDYYEVSINGEHFLRYNHRLPYHTVEKLHFRGDVSFEEVNYSTANDPPPYSPSPEVNTEATKVGISNQK